MRTLLDWKWRGFSAPPPKKAFGADDPGTYFEYFDPAATFIFHSSPNRLQSRAEYQQEWALWRRDMDFHVRSCTSSDQRVQLIGDIAILTHHVMRLLASANVNGGPILREAEAFEVAGIFGATL